jgi:hypothetical protein
MDEITSKYIKIENFRLNKIKSKYIFIICMSYFGNLDEVREFLWKISINSRLFLLKGN